MNAIPHDTAQAAKHPDAHLQQMLQVAFTETDRSFAKLVGDHWETLGKPEVQEQIAKEGDIPAHRFSRWHLINTLGEVRAQLARRMANVADEEDFADECASFINDQIDHLFFVTNDMAAAQIARDYFDTFLTNSTAGLLTLKKIDKDTAESYDALREYYDVGFNAYDDLRELVSIESQGVTSSLVAYALTKHSTPENRRTMGKLVPLSHTNPDATAMLREMSDRTYQEMMAHQPIFHGEKLHYRPMSAWIYRQACMIAQDEFTSDTPEQFDRAASHDRNRKHMMTQVDLINRALASIDQEGEIEGILEAQRMFDAQRKERLNMPETFDELLETALIDACAESHKRINDTVLADAQRRLSGPTPKSERLGKTLWAYLDDPRVAVGGAEELNQYWKRELERCPSPHHVAAKADMLLDELAEDIGYSSASPALLLHAANFLGTLRRSLGSLMHEEGAFRPEDYAAIKRVEEKCLHYYESHYTLREWMMTKTMNAYDRLGTLEYMKYAVETGRTWHDLQPSEWNNFIVPAAQEQFVAMLREMNVHHKGCEHLLVPLVAAKARTIAGKELGEPDPNADDEAMAAQYEKVWARAGEILKGALDSLPQRDADSGRKVKVQPFTAEHVGKLMQDLDQKIKTAGHRGTRH